MESYNQPPSPTAQVPGRQLGPAPRRKTGLIVALVALLGFFALAVIMSFAVASVFEMPDAGTAAGQLKERKIAGSGSSRVARIDVSGVITGGDSFPFSSSVESADSVIERLKTAAADKTVSGVLLRVDSPGGGVTASDRIHREVARLAKSKKVAVLMGDQAASGGYYVSVAADRIFAHPTTVTGSIGVIMTTLNVHDLAKQLGIRSVVVKSSEGKDLLSPFKPPEEIEKDKLVYQKVVTHLYERFTQLVSEGRKMPMEKVRELADGRVYDAQTAVENGLIDAIGYEDDVLAWFKKQLKQDDFILFEYIRPVGVFSRLLMESRARSTARLSPEQLFPWWSLRSRPAYLWLPGI